MLEQIGSFLQAHQVAIGVLVTAALDFAIEVHPSLKGNNVVGLILGFFKKEPPQA